MRLSLILSTLVIIFMSGDMVAAEAPETPGSTDFLTVYGEAWMPGGHWPMPDGFEIFVVNENTGDSRTAVVGDSEPGIFEVVFFDNGEVVASEGDTISFSVEGGGYFDPGEGWVVLTARHVEACLVRYDVMPYYVSEVPMQSRTMLGQPYPNPFNPIVTIPFELEESGSVEVTVHDLRGRLVAVLNRGSRSAGSYAVTWRGIDTRGRGVPAGTYLVGLQAGDFREFKKVTLVE